MTLSDVECRRVRQRAFQAVADLDNHLAVLDEHKKNHTITPLLLADAPRLCHALCVIGDIRVALHFRKNRDHDLVGSLSLELSKLFVEPRCGFLGNNAGVIVEVRARRYRDQFRGVRADREQRERGQKKVDRVPRTRWDNYAASPRLVWHRLRRSRSTKDQVHIMAPLSLRAPERAS